MIEIENLTFQYNEAKAPALRDVNLEIDRGEFVLLTGPSGCGKSTMCRCLNGLIPNFYGGTISGRVFVNGVNVQKMPTKEMARFVGTIFQDPENQLLTTEVEREVAFGLENLDAPLDVMKLRVDKALSLIDINKLRHENPTFLSGGQKQKVALASVLAMEPEVLILDEPISELDKQSATKLLTFLKKLNEESNITILISEHRVSRILDFANRILTMDEGKIVEDCPAYHFKCSEDSHKWIANLKEKSFQPKNQILARVRDVHFSYDNGIKALDGVNLDIHEEEFLVITGPNASGKTTLAKHLNGLLKPSSGSVKIAGLDTRERAVSALSKIVGYVPQNPNDLLFEETVEDEVSFFMKNLRLDKTRIKHKSSELLTEFGLGEYKNSYPRSLSGGEKQRVAIASVAAGNPEILVLDEPTRGMDIAKKFQLIEFLDNYRKSGKSVVLITHYTEMVDGFADRIIMMDKGKIMEA